MGIFLVLRLVWWLAAVPLVASTLFVPGTPHVAAWALTFFLLALLSWWAVYLLRAWLFVALGWLCLATGGHVAALLDGAMTGISLAVAIGLFVLYQEDFRATLRSRRLQQAEMLAACQRPGTGTVWLLLTAFDGMGHLTAARDWVHRITVKNPDAHVICLEVFTLLPHWFQVVWQSWEYFAAYVPEVHALTHFLLRHSPRWLVRRAAKHLATQLSAMNSAEYVVTTHPLAAVIAQTLLGPAHASSHGVMVCTDFFINPAATNLNFHEVRLPRDLVQEKQCASTTERDALWAKLGLVPGKHTALFLTGGSGLIPMEKAYKVLRLLQDCRSDQGQILLVCGTNRRLYEWATKWLRDVPNVTVVGFVPNLDSFQHHFDLVVTKAGGLTVATLVGTGNIDKAIVWYAFRGQEGFNLRFFLEWGGSYTPSFFRRKLRQRLLGLR